MLCRNILNNHFFLLFFFLLGVIGKAEGQATSNEHVAVIETQDGTELIGFLSGSSGLLFETDINTISIVVEKINSFAEGSLDLKEEGPIEGRFVSGEFIVTTLIGDVRQAATNVTSIRFEYSVSALDQYETQSIVFSVSGQDEGTVGYFGTGSITENNTVDSGVAVTTPSVIEPSPTLINETDPVSELFAKIQAGDIPTLKSMYSAFEYTLTLESYKTISNGILRDKLIEKAGANFVGHLVVDELIEVIADLLEDNGAFSTGCPLGIFCDKLVFTSLLLTAKNMLVLDVKSQLVDQVFLIAESWQETATALDGLPCPSALPLDERLELMKLYWLKELVGSPLPEDCDEFCTGDNTADSDISTSLFLFASAAGKSVQQGGCLPVDVPAGEGITIDVAAKVVSSELELTLIPSGGSDWPNPGEQIVWYLNHERVGTSNAISLRLAPDYWPYLLEARIEPITMAGSTPPIAPSVTTSLPSMFVEVLVTENPEWTCRGRVGADCKDGNLTEELTSRSQVTWDEKSDRFVVEGRMSVGAIKHDKCCDDYPDGFRCQGRFVERPTVGTTVCEAEWDQAVEDVLGDKRLTDTLNEVVELWDFTWIYPSEPNDPVSSVADGWREGIAPDGARVNQDDAEADKIYCESQQVTKQKVSDTWVCGNSPEDLLAAECVEYEKAMAGIKDAPPCPFADNSSYLFELHALPLTGMATSDVVLYKTIGSKRKVALIHEGELLSVLESRLLTVPCPLKVLESKTAYIEGPCRPRNPRRPTECLQELGPGELIFFIKYIGEGTNRYWSRGELVQAPAVSIPLNPDIPQSNWLEEVIPCGKKDKFWNPARIQWFRVKSAEGREGWTKDITSIDLEEKG